ncbi:hypothetical protein [Xanthomonas phage X2]|nr:hypothetical protein [Xanthomonas phage X2]
MHARKRRRSAGVNCGSALPCWTPSSGATTSFSALYASCPCFVMKSLPVVITSMWLSLASSEASRCDSTYATRSIPPTDATGACALGLAVAAVRWSDDDCSALGASSPPVGSVASPPVSALSASVPSETASAASVSVVWESSPSAVSSSVGSECVSTMIGLDSVSTGVDLRRPRLRGVGSVASGSSGTSANASGGAMSGSSATIGSTSSTGSGLTSTGHEGAGAFGAETPRCINAVSSSSSVIESMMIFTWYPFAVMTDDETHRYCRSSQASRGSAPRWCGYVHEGPAYARATPHRDGALDARC